MLLKIIVARWEGNISESRSPPVHQRKTICVVNDPKWSCNSRETAKIGHFGWRIWNWMQIGLWELHVLMRKGPASLTLPALSHQRLNWSSTDWRSSRFGHFVRKSKFVRENGYGNLDVMTETRFACRTMQLEPPTSSIWALGSNGRDSRIALPQVTSIKKSLILCSSETKKLKWNVSG